MISFIYHNSDLFSNSSILLCYMYNNFRSNPKKEFYTAPAVSEITAGAFHAITFAEGAEVFLNF